MLIMLDDMIVDIEVNENLSTIATELFLRGRKLNILLVFILQFYFKGRKTVRLNSTHYFIMKIPKKENFNK